MCTFAGIPAACFLSRQDIEQRMKTLTLRGDAFAIGEQLGQAGHSAWHQTLTATSLWQTVIALKDSPQARSMAAAVEQHYPLIWQELAGLASGLQAPFDEVFAWNCRGDLVRSTSDGCTTLSGRDEQGRRLIAHNEDGFPQLKDECFIAQVFPDQGAAYLSFAYPGSLCGHTLSVNQYGVVNTVNNIRAAERPAGIPRQVLARDALNASDLDDAVARLTAPSRAGAFHHTLGCVGDPRLFTVEATGQQCSVLEVTQSYGHANHLVHPSQRQAAQVITDSSAARQRVIDAQLAGKPVLSEKLCVQVLSDTSERSLPVYRQDADDPDQENTLASVVFVIDDQGVRWSLYRDNRQQPELSGNGV